MPTHYLIGNVDFLKAVQNVAALCGWSAKI